MLHTILLACVAAAGTASTEVPTAPAPERPARMTGTVLGFRSDEPMELTLVPAAPTDPAREARTLTVTDGRFEVDDLAPGRYRVWFIVGTPDTAVRAIRQEIEIEPGAARTLTLDVSARVRVRGKAYLGKQRLRDADLAFALVEDGRMTSILLRTDDEGSFVAGLPSKGTYDVLAARTTTEPTGQARARIEVSRTNQTEDLWFQDAQLVARVLDPLGQPVPDAVVHVTRTEPLPAAEDSTQPSVPRFPAQAYTDQDGEFQVIGLDRGEYRLGIRARGKQAIEIGPVALESNEQRRLPDILLEDAWSIEVTVYGDGGQPVDEVAVFVAHADDLRPAFLPFSYTDAAGEARIDGLETGTYSLVALARGYMPAIVDDITVDAADIRGPIVRLAAGGALEVRVLDGDGAPAPGVVLTLHDAKGRDLTQLFAILGHRFRTDETGLVYLPKVQPGTVSVALESPRKADPVEVRVESGKIATVELCAARAARRD